MAPSLLDFLVRLALAGSGAIVLVLLLRRPLRRFAGADAAYLAWLALPFALIAAALPAPSGAPALVVAMAPALNASAYVAKVAPAAFEWIDWLPRVWACGAMATGLLFVIGQRAFVRSLGRLTERDGIYVAEHARHGPALLGLLRPIVVVPADFATRYTPEEQALVVAHERQHAIRRDPLANAALALLQCAFWFNPLTHIAASRFRFDQELACDAGVIARHGAGRQAYAAAMLKTQASGALAPATCHWQSSHPLKERIMHLKQTSTSAPRRRAGRLIVAALAIASVLGTVGARAGTAADGQEYEIAVKFADGADGTTPMVRVKAGEEFALNWKQPGHGWKGVFTVTPASAESVMVKMTVTPEKGEVFAPSMLLKLGQAGTVSKDGAESKVQIGLTVTKAPAAAQGT